jgi:hypothetical protein
MFHNAWVVGALIPVLPFMPKELGHSDAGVVALVIQVAYVSLVLLPHHREPPLVIDVRQSGTAPVRSEPERVRPGVLDLI